MLFILCRWNGACCGVVVSDDVRRCTTEDNERTHIHARTRTQKVRCAKRQTKFPKTTEPAPAGGPLTPAKPAATVRVKVIARRPVKIRYSYNTYITRAPRSQRSMKELTNKRTNENTHTHAQTHKKGSTSSVYDNNNNNNNIHRK